MGNPRSIYVIIGSAIMNNRDESILCAASLHENARRFIESAIEHAEVEWQPSPTFAAVHLATGIELLLKARLALHEMTELARKPTAVRDQDIAEGAFESVTTKECLERLRKHNLLVLSDRQKSDLRMLQHLRNRAIHFISPNLNEIRGALGKGLNLFVEIDKKEFDYWDPPKGCKEMAVLMRVLIENKEFVGARMQSLSEQLERSFRPRTHYLDECPHCVQDAIVIEDDYFHCLFCGYENEITFEAERRSYDRKTEQCPNCGRRTLTTLEFHADKSSTECICCGFFTGRRQIWRDWLTKMEICRLHPDRFSSSEDRERPFPD